MREVGGLLFVILFFLIVLTTCDPMWAQPPKPDPLAAVEKSCAVCEEKLCKEIRTRGEGFDITRPFTVGHQAALLREQLKWEMTYAFYTGPVTKGNLDHTVMCSVLKARGRAYDVLKRGVHKELANVGLFYDISPTTIMRMWKARNKIERRSQNERTAMGDIRRASGTGGVFPGRDTSRTEDGGP